MDTIENGLKEYNKLLFGENNIKNSISATQEQVKFLMDIYKDEDSIIGIHNTIADYKSIFEHGLYNYTSSDNKTADLSNTVMYSDCFSELVAYSNGNNELKEDTSILLKIPKEVFLHERGIFEKLQNDSYGIPPQYICAAFNKGRIIENPAYDKSYYSVDAEKCNDTITFLDKKINLKVFKQCYYDHKNIFSKIKDFIKSFQKKPKLLEAPKNTNKIEVNVSKNSKIENFKNNLHVDIPNKSFNENQIDSSDKYIGKEEQDNSRN